MNGIIFCLSVLLVGMVMHSIAIKNINEYLIFIFKQLKEIKESK